MSIESDIQNDLTEYRVSGKDNVKRDFLAFLLSELQAKAHVPGRNGKPVTDSEQSDILKKVLNSCQKTKEGALQYSRPEEAVKADVEISIIEHYLPASLSLEATQTLIETAIRDLNASGMKWALLWLNVRFIKAHILI